MVKKNLGVLKFRQLFRHLRLRKKYPLFIIIALFSIGAVAKYSGLIINITPSMKQGLYVKRQGDVKRGDIVLVCLGEPYQTIGLQRLYLIKGRSCQGTDPLIKEVIAIPEDDIILTDNFIQVNHIKYHCSTYYRDSKGRPLVVYPRGLYKNTSGYWLIGNYDVKSWDSRYWGPVSRKQILSVLRPLLTW